MKLAINWTSADSGIIAQKLIKSGHIDFVEVLVDNFFKYQASEIRQLVGDVPVSFHIMFSQFAERNLASLTNYATKIRKLIKELKPIYVSDHIAQFSINGIQLPQTMELNYSKSESLVTQRVTQYQNMIDKKIYFENFPSNLKQDFSQIDFFKNLIKKTNCGLLFDISNAEVAETNVGVSFTHWLPLLKATQHYHIGAFSSSDSNPTYLIDSHNAQPNMESQSKAKRYLSKDSYLVVEQDFNLDQTKWEHTLETLRSIHVKT